MNSDTTPGTTFSGRCPELEIVQKILDLWRTGQSLRTIAGKLNADGVPTKPDRRWHHTTIGTWSGGGGGT
jgi:hypothetical protein